MQEVASIDERTIEVGLVGRRAFKENRILIDVAGWWFSMDLEIGAQGFEISRFS